MPRGDRTGPLGFGPMTGRAAGYCAGFGMPGFVNPAPGLAMGARFGRGGRFWGRGGGRGWRNMFYATGLTGMQRAAMGWPAFGWGFYGAPASPAPTKEQQAQMFKAQAEFLEEQLDSVKKSMEELSARDDAEKEG
jgi:hypothetical protein